LTSRTRVRERRRGTEGNGWNEVRDVPECESEKKAVESLGIWKSTLIGLDWIESRFVTSVLTLLVFVIV